MVSKEEIIKGVEDFFNGDYSITSGYVIPGVDDIPLGKNGREIEVDGLRRTTAAKMYKSFLWGVAQIARLNNGELRSFNGDGVLVVFIGKSKRTAAAKAALQMSWFAKKVLKPKLDTVFQNNQSLQNQRIEFDLGIGIDVGKVLVVRGGIRGENNNDLVWVGNATNYAVRLSELSKDGYTVYISEDVYKLMDRSSKFSGTPEKNMWEERTWNAMGEISIYRSNWTWPVS